MNKVGRNTLVDGVVENILSAISHGELQAGDKLPTHDELTALLSVSRSTVREALKRLEALGVVRTAHGGGTFVEEVSFSTLVDTLIPLVKLESGDVDAFIEAREIIEVQVVRLAATRATDAGLEKMRKLISQMETSIENHNEFIRLDTEFHITIAECSQNPVLPKFLLMISDLMREQQHQVFLLPNVVEISLNYHKQILRAIEDRDPDEAAKAMKEHLDNIPARFHQSASKEGSNSRLAQK